MEQENEKLELVYGLEDKPSPLETAYAALQHLLSSPPPGRSVSRCRTSPKASLAGSRQQSKKS